MKVKYEVVEPNRTFELPFKKSDITGDYIIIPRHIGGKNSLRKLQASKVNEGYIYLIRIKDTNEYKIGVSTNPKRRLRDISSYIPYELDVLALNKISNLYQFEEELLNDYKEYSIKKRVVQLRCRNS